MRIPILIGILLAATAAVLLLPGLLGGSDAPPPEAGERPASGGPTLTQPGEGPLKGDPPPVEQPEPQRLRLAGPLRVLLLTDRPTSWGVFHASAIRSDPRTQVTAWITDGSVNPDLGDPLPTPSPPTAAWFEQQDFELLVICHFDTRSLEPAFWESVAGRVRAKTLGLWVHCSLPLPVSASGERLLGQPLLEQPSLASVLPVLTAKPITGSPPPGVFTSEVPFGVTAAGERHIASRIVLWPEWSRRIWQLSTTGQNPWGSMSCYPAETLREGSTVLVEARPAGGAPIPIYIAGPPALGRVLWFGAFDFGQMTYRSATAVEQLRAMLSNAAIWLAGRAPPEEEVR